MSDKPISDWTKEDIRKERERVQSEIAYLEWRQSLMSIPRCDQCTWWEETNVLALGECRLFEADRYHGQMHLDAKLVIRSGRYAKSYEGGVAVTCADFGCTQFQSREAKWMTDGIKTLDEINVSEWARWEWEFEGENKEGRTVLTRGRERLPDEAVKAYRDFKEWLHIRRGIEVVEP